MDESVAIKFVAKSKLPTALGDFILLLRYFLS